MARKPNESLATAIAKGTVEAEPFDVFLCHNSKDKPSVRRLHAELQARGVRAWFDEIHCLAGRRWQSELERTILRIQSAAVIVGPNGSGPWQDMEVQAFIQEFLTRGCPVIPVLLENAGAQPELPLFLRQFGWVDFRNQASDPWGRLLAGIRGPATPPP